MNDSSSSRARSVLLQVESLEERRVLSTAAYVSALYTTLLHRAPDAAGVASWASLIDQGALSPAQVTSDFTTSAEFRTNLIEADYQQLLGRTPQPPEVAYWLTGLENGLPEGELASLFQGSAEYFQNHGGTAAGWLAGVYQDDLGRAPDAAGEATWLAGLQNGLPRQMVAAEIAASPEALARVVTAAYQNVLGRDPDPQGLAGWTASLARGLPPSQMLAAFAASPEFINAQGGLGKGQSGGTPSSGNDFQPGTDITPVVILPVDTGTVITSGGEVTPIDTSCSDATPVDTSSSDDTCAVCDCCNDTTDPPVTPPVDPGTDSSDTTGQTDTLP
jgi:hypothetical protein